MALRLLHSPAQVIRQALVDVGVATHPDVTTPSNTNWPANFGSETDSGDNKMTVYRTTPVQDGSDNRTGEAWYHFGFQVMIVAKNAELGDAKAEEVHEALTQQMKLRWVTLGANVYRIGDVSKCQGVIDLGKDAGHNHRNRYSINAMVTVTRIS